MKLRIDGLGIDSKGFAEENSLSRSLDDDDVAKLRMRKSTDDRRESDIISTKKSLENAKKLCADHFTTAIGLREFFASARIYKNENIFEREKKI